MAIGASIAKLDLTNPVEFPGLNAALGSPWSAVLNGGPSSPSNHSEHHADASP